MAELLSLILPVAAGGYLLGSIPFGYLLVNLLRGEDIRATGSGNIGATNVARVSPLLGLVTLALDAAKGLLSVGLTKIIENRSVDEQTVRVLMAIAALSAVLGHVFPIWLKFRGGKGVATALGSFVLLAPKAMLLAVGVFLLVLAAFRYVSLGSIVAVGIFPLLIWLIEPHLTTPLTIAIVAAGSLLIVGKHHQNIRRLLAGSENRFQWRRG